MRPFELLKGMILDSEPFTSENGKLTVSHKLNRNYIANIYNERIENLYELIDSKKLNTFLTLKELLDKVLKNKENLSVSGQEIFLDIGGDSLSAINLQSLINSTFQTNLSAQVIVTQKLSDIANYIELQQKYNITVQPEREKQIDLNEELSVLDNLKFNINTSLTDNITKKVLLTGVTGFLGSFILNELVNSTDFIIFVIIRAANKIEAEKRLRNTLNKYLLNTSLDRVEIVCTYKKLIK